MFDRVGACSTDDDDDDDGDENEDGGRLSEMLISSGSVEWYHVGWCNHCGLLITVGVLFVTAGY